MVEKSGMHFELCSKLYDHAAHPFQRATAEAPVYPDDWENISFEDKRKATDGLISSISATSEYVKIEWKI